MKKRLATFSVASKTVTDFPFSAWALLYLITNSISYLMGIDRIFLGSTVLLALSVSYPLYLLGVDRVIEYSRSRALAWKLVYLLLFYDAFDMPNVPNGLACVILYVLLIFVIFIAPWMMRRHQSSQGHRKPPQTIDEREAWNMIVAQLCVFMLFVAYSFGFGMDYRNSNEGNGLREACRSELSGLSASEVDSRVSAQFRQQVANSGEIELAHYGRGCRIRFKDGKAEILYLIPRWGFPWSLHHHLPSATRPYGGRKVSRG